MVSSPTPPPTPPDAAAAAAAFETFADAYDAMIDWPKRLANDEALFRWLFDQVGVARVLDAACGTGHHAAMFHEWGLAVDGADISPAMIGRCRALHGEDERLRWTVRGFEEPPDPGQAPFDAAICIGNSLALAPTRERVDAAITQMLAAVRPDGGAVVLHVMNLWKLPEGRPVWQKCQRATLAGRESLIIKGVQRTGNRGMVHLLVSDLSAGSNSPPALQSDAAPFWGLSAEDLSTACTIAGATSVEVFGDHRRSPYDPAASSDLIVIARR